MRKLETVADLIDAVREVRGWTSDYQVAVGLKIPPRTVTSWRRGDRAPGEKHALLIAEVLRISPALVLAISAVQKSVDKNERSAWRQVIEQIAQLGLPAIAGISFLSASYAPTVQALGAGSVYSVKRRRRSQEALQPA